MAGENNKAYLLFILIGGGLLPLVSSYCFDTYTVKTTGDFLYRCRSRRNDVAGNSLDECCSIEGVAGYSTNYRGKYCDVCESALAEEDKTPVWSDWEEWSQCSRTCDTGLRTRRRQCEQGICEGSTIEQEDCIIVQFCPVDGNWGTWSNWNSCSTTCSVGIRSRTRRCDNPVPEFNGKTCLQIGGDSFEQEDCVETENCPINGHWSNWKPFGQCSKTCGLDAERVRNRECDNPPAQYGGSYCVGSPQQIQNCELGRCPINGNWGSWSPWIGCSRTCGVGKSVRKRSCNNPKPLYNGKACVGASNERKDCNLGNCIEIVDWTDWSPWSSCDDCIKYKSQKRTRKCPIENAQNGNVKCEGAFTEYRECTSKEDCIEEVDEDNGSGSGCIGDECCDDADGCQSESSDASFSSSVDTFTTPLPTRCRPPSTPATELSSISGSSGSNSVSEGGNSVSEGGNSVSEGGDSEAGTSFIWVDCPEEEIITTPPPRICKETNEFNCQFSDYYDSSISDYEEDKSEVNPTIKPGDESSSISSEDDYGSSLKEDSGGNGGGGGGNGGGGGGNGGGDDGGSFSSL